MDHQPMEAGPLVVLGSIWNEDGCQLQVRRPHQESFLVPLVGLDLNYRIERDGPRHCVGHRSPKRNEGRYVECHNQPQAGHRTCVSCAVADAEFAADLHHAHTRAPEGIHQAVLDHLQRPNVLYLAAFRDGSVKVGTSTGTRHHTRLVEQGAWRAVGAATVSDGFAVRRLEDLVTERLGLAQSVATSRKLRGMVSPRPDDELDRILTEHLDQVHDLLVSDDGADAVAATPTAVWWRFPGSDDPCWQRPHRYPIPLTTGRHHLWIDGACGRLVASTRPTGHDRFVDDLGPLYGRELEVGCFQPDPVLVQDSLF